MTPIHVRLKRYIGLNKNLEGEECEAWVVANKNSNGLVITTPVRHSQHTKIKEELVVNSKVYGQINTLDTLTIKFDSNGRNLQRSKIVALYSTEEKVGEVVKYMKRCEVGGAGIIGVNMEKTAKNGELVVITGNTHIILSKRLETQLSNNKIKNLNSEIFLLVTGLDKNTPTYSIDNPET